MNLIHTHGEKMTRPPVDLLLALAAGLAAYVAVHQCRGVIDAVLSEALDEVERAYGSETGHPLPESTREIAMAAPSVVFPMLAFAFIYCAATLVLNFIDFHLEHKEPPVAIAVPIGMPAHEQPYVALPPSEMAVPGQWSDGLCGFCNDCKLCLTGCLCFFVPLGQAYERVIGKRGSCLAIVAFFSVSYLFISSASGVCQPEIVCAGEGAARLCQPVERDRPAACEWASGVSTGVTIGAAILLMLVRSRVRTAFHIQPSCCGPCDDCCCGFFCLPLSACQILRWQCCNLSPFLPPPSLTQPTSLPCPRHLGVVQGTRYSACSPIGSELPERLVAV